MIHYRVGLRTGVEGIHKKFILSAVTYSVDDLNAKKETVLQKRQEWEAPQIKNLKLVIPQH